jgi:anti-sigma-K factor RskA
VTRDHDEVAADLAAYALGSLPAAERVRVEAHVAACAVCAEELARYRAVIGALPLALAPAVPPRAAWDTVRAAVPGRRSAPPARPNVAVARWCRMSRWPAVAALVTALVAWNVVLERRLADPRGPQIEALSRRPGRLVVLRGEQRPTANARIFLAVDGHHGHMAISGLSPLPRERTYQLWFVSRDGPAESGAIFGVDARGQAWVTIAVTRALADIRTIVVTEEPAAGGAAPTGPPLLAAEAWR